MMFDLQTVAIVAFIVVVSAGVLLFISVVVTKEKTFEEVIAEQRQQSKALLLTQPKQKPKEKKPKEKKANKKIKEKTSAPLEQEIKETKTVNEPTVETPPPTLNTNHHVNFAEPAVVEEPPKDTQKKREKKDKVRPILLNRDMSEENIVVDGAAVATNHFEELHPKDEFELLHSASKDNSPKKEKVVVKEKQEVLKKTKSQTVETQTNPTKEEVPTRVTETKVTQTNGFVAQPAKEKRKKKSDPNSIEQLTSDKDGPNLHQLTALVRKAELSPSEVQSLIELLLNMQHEAPLLIDEWSEGKADLNQKLKKQLADSERQQHELQEALQGLQAKLREVRAEQQAEKAAAQQRARTLEDEAVARRHELQQAAQKLAAAQQQLEPLREQLSAAAAANRKLRDDADAYQLQAQQLQLAVAQAQEKHDAVERQHQGVVAQAQHQATVLQGELERKDDYVRRVEEEKRDLEERLVIIQNEFQQKLQSIYGEYDVVNSQLNSQLKSAEDEKQRLSLELEASFQEERRAHQVEVRNLQNQLSSLKQQLESRDSSHEAALERVQSDLDRQRAKNNELREKNWKVMEALNAAENRNKTQLEVKSEDLTKVKTEMQTLNKKFIQKLFPATLNLPELPYEKWCGETETLVNNYIKSCENAEKRDSAELSRLEKENRYLKTVIGETEDTLRDIQKGINREESRWKQELEEKEKQLRLFEAASEILQKQLAEVRKDSVLENEAKAIDIRRLNENITTLTQQLEESNKNNQVLQNELESSRREIGVKLNNHNGASANGPSVTIETALSSSSCSAASSNCEVKQKKSKKKKRKNNSS